MVNKFIILFFLTAVITACQKKQYFTASPEIDLIKKGNEAYLKADWATFKSLYADTAKVLVNEWWGGEITVDKFIEMEKEQIANFAEYKIGDDAIFEMVETDDGARWVHSWFLWSAKHKNGKEARTAVHLSAQVKNGKIVMFGIIADNLPGYLMNPPMDSMAMPNQ